MRTPPDSTWTWSQTSADALYLLNEWINDDSGEDGLTISLDHDLGGDDTTRPIVLWMAENGIGPWIDEVLIHTANPVGREWIEGMVKRYLS
nr:cyclic-phosphate processing receiver domain-containing protein [Mycolicibacterium sp. BK634]